MLGSGNREQILEQGQGCGPDNLFSCCQGGCSVATSTTIDYGVCSSSGSFACSSSGQMTSGALAEGCGASGASACTDSSNPFSSTSSYSLDCSGSTSTASGLATCDSDGLCTVNPVGSGHDLTPSNAGTCANKARFYGIWSYGGLDITQKSFSTDPSATWTTAQTFDQNRFTDAASYTGCTFTANGKCSLLDTTQVVMNAAGVKSCADGTTTCQVATIDDPGWFYTYNTTCPTVAACPPSTTCTNEKSASGATVLNSCSMWNSFVPLGSAQSGSNPCGAANTATQTAIAYASHYVSGAPDAVCNLDKDSTALYRGQQRSTIAPPSAPMVRMGVSQDGQVSYSTLQMDPGASPSSSSLGQRDLAAPLYWLEVSRDSHNCRHVANANCE
jgi:hypothetical protein